MRRERERGIQKLTERLRRIELKQPVGVFLGEPVDDIQITDLYISDEGILYHRNSDNSDWVAPSETAGGPFVLAVEGTDIDSLGTPSGMAMGYTSDDGLYFVYTTDSGWVDMSRYT